MDICRKVFYKDRKTARKFLKQLKKVKGVNVTTAYDCPNCQGWHLTSGSKQGSRNYTRHLNKKK